MAKTWIVPVAYYDDVTIEQAGTHVTLWIGDVQDDEVYMNLDEAREVLAALRKAIDRADAYAEANGCPA